jgi:hypothetical protein
MATIFFRDHGITARGASASRVYRTFRRGDLECLMGSRAGSHGLAVRKALTRVLACCGLVFVIGITAGCGSPSSATPVTTASSLVARAPAGTPSPAVTKAATAAQTVTTAPSTQAQTTAAAQGAAPSTPARTTTAPPAPRPSTAPASCYPLSNEGTCYEPGEFCRKSDHGESGVAGDGKAIKCEDNDGWRWEPV